MTRYTDRQFPYKAQFRPDGQYFSTTFEALKAADATYRRIWAVVELGELSAGFHHLICPVPMTRAYPKAACLGYFITDERHDNNTYYEIRIVV